MRLIDDIGELLFHRPHARVLVLEMLEDDANNLVMDMRAQNYNAGMSHKNQILVMAVAQYSQHKMRLGVVDIVFVNNRYNVLRVDRAKQFKGIVQYLNNQRHKILWHIGDVTPPLGIVPLVTDVRWRCGEPFAMPSPSYVLIAQESYTAPCGAGNVRAAWFCRECGRFRGLSYKE